MSNEGKKNIFARLFGAIWRWIKRHKVLTVILVLLIALIIYVVNVVNKAKELLQKAAEQGSLTAKQLLREIF